MLQSSPLHGLLELDISSNELTSLEGSQYLPNLRSLHARQNQLTVRSVLQSPIMLSED